MPEGGSDAAGQLICSLDCRYVGQEYTLTVDVPSVGGQVLADAPAIQALFEDAHQSSFGYELNDAVEIVTVRATIRRELGQFAGGRQSPAGEDAQVDPKYVEAWSFQTGTHERFSVVDRSFLASKAELKGPAIVLEPTATTYLDRGCSLQATAGGELVISLEHPLYEPSASR
jgi:N-methylhydantoinase A